MEPVLQGWLVKSPPEKKSVGTFKIFGAKWRRRYFVLYAPPAVEGAQAAVGTALLEYYSDKKLHHKHGTIDLTNCEEIYTELDSALYKHVFCIQTTHKFRSRTYYLAAETEAEMSKWVNTLCKILGLAESDEPPAALLPSLIEAKIQQILQPYAANRPVTQIPVVSKPQPNYASHPKPSSPDPPRPFTTVACQRSGSEPNLLDITSANKMNELVGPGSGTCSSNWLRNAGSVPELDKEPERKRDGGGRQRDVPPPLPPERGQPNKGVELYDMPPGSQRNVADANADAGLCYDMPPSRSKPNAVPNYSFDDFYNTPPSHAVAVDCEADSFYNTPRSENANTEDYYNTPPSKDVGGKSSKNVGLANNQRLDDVVTEELYNVPKAELDKQKLKASKSDSTGAINGKQSVTPFQAQDELYNVPREQNRLNAKVSEPNSGIPASVGSDELYNVPRELMHSKENKSKSADVHKQPVNVSAQAETRRAPRPLPGNVVTHQADEDLNDQTYDNPSKRLPSNRTTPAATAVHQSVVATSDEVYNVPAACRSQPAKSQPISETARKVETHAHTSSYPAAASGQHVQTATAAAVDETYDVPPQKQHAAAAAVDETYDVPPQKQHAFPPVPAKRNQPPPPKPPRPSPGALPGDISGGSAPTAAVSSGTSDGASESICGFIVAEAPASKHLEHTADNSAGSQDAETELQTGIQKSATPPCVSKKGAPPIELRDSIRFTQRSKSFKRSMPSVIEKETEEYGDNLDFHSNLNGEATVSKTMCLVASRKSLVHSSNELSQQRSALPLPVKRIVEQSESSSSDDDETPTASHHKHTAV